MSKMHWVLYPLLSILMLATLAVAGGVAPGEEAPQKKQVLLGREKLFEQPINQLPILLLNHMPSLLKSIRQLLTNRELMLEEIDLL